MHTSSRRFDAGQMPVILKPLTAPQKERISPGYVSFLPRSPPRSLSLTHTQPDTHFFFLSLRCPLSLILSLSFSLSLSRPSLTSEVLKCTPGPNRTEQPL